MKSSRLAIVILTLSCALIGVLFTKAPVHASYGRSAPQERLAQAAATSTSTAVAFDTETPFPTPPFFGTVTPSPTPLGTPPPVAPASTARQTDHSVVAQVTIPRGYYCANPDTSLPTFYAPQGWPQSYPACVVSSTPMAASPIDLSWEWSVNGEWQSEAGNNTFFVHWARGQLQLVEFPYSGPLSQDITIRYQGIEASGRINR